MECKVKSSRLFARRVMVGLLSVCLIATMGFVPWGKSFAAEQEQTKASQAAQTAAPAETTATKASSAETTAASTSETTSAESKEQNTETSSTGEKTTSETQASSSGEETGTSAEESGDMTSELVGRNISEAENDPKLAELLDDPSFNDYYIIDEDGVIRLNKSEAGDGLLQAGGLASAKLPSRYKSGYNVYRAIDISNWQGALSVSQFKQIKDLGISRVIVRVGYSSIARGPLNRHADAVYGKNINNAYSAGLKVGVYYYSQATSVSEAKKEADYTLGLIKKYRKKITLPVVFDYEFGRRLNSSNAKKLGKNGVANVAIAFCDKVRAAGYTPMYYASAQVLCNYVNRDTIHKKYQVWLAHYTNGKATDYAKNINMWQYTSSGKLRNKKTGRLIVDGRIDMNYMFVKKAAPKKTGKTGWIKQKNGKYKYMKNGTYQKSKWLTLSGKKYYVNRDGYRLVGYHKVGNYYFGFNSNGVMYKNTTVKLAKKKRTFLKNGRAVLYTGKVTASTLSYRTGPSTKYKEMGTNKRGTKVKIVRNSGKWSQLSNGYWSYSGYIKK